MTNSLIESRNLFSKRYAETKICVNARHWGVVRAGRSGPALLLLPGTLGRGDIFWYQIGALSAQARVIALSYPDSGSMEEWAADICEILDRADIRSATVLGSSLGGYLAQYFAMIFTKRVDAVIAANTLSAVDILKNIPPYSKDITAIPVGILRQGFSDSMTAWAIDEPDRKDLVDLLLFEISGRIPAAELRQRLQVLKKAPKLPVQPAEMLKIYTIDSDDDRLIPAPVRAHVKQYLQPIDSLTFKRGSHFPYITHASEYTRFLEKVLHENKS